MWKEVMAGVRSLNALNAPTTNSSSDSSDLKEGSVTSSSSSSSKEMLKKFVCWLLHEQKIRLGWGESISESSDRGDTMLRPLVLGALVGNGDATTTAEARAHFASAVKKNVAATTAAAAATPPPPAAAADVSLSSDLLETVLKAGVRGGGEEEFKQVLALYHSHHLTEVVYYHFYYHWCEPVSDSKLVYHILSFLRSRHFVILMHVLTAGQIKMHSCSCLHPRAYPPSAYAALCIQPHG